MSCVRYRFGELELDLPQRELRLRGEPRPLQPQTFELLTYLIERRDRVVPKEELLEALWPDTVVTDGSLQRTVSLARAALKGKKDEHIRTFPRRGYRFVAAVSEVKANEAPPAKRGQRPRYARSGDAHIAYRTLGEGALDIVLIAGWAFPMQSFDELRECRTLLEELGTIGRVVLFDKRGTGLSDRVKRVPSFQQRVQDLGAVLDMVHSEKTILVGISEGGPLAIGFAADHPERVHALVLVGAFPCFVRRPDFPHGWKPSQLAELRGYVTQRWGDGATVLAFASERRNDDDVRTWARAAERNGASPGAALDLVEMNASIDVRDRLPDVDVRTVVLQATDDPVVAAGNGRYLAEHIRGARHVEVPGDDHALLFVHRSVLIDAIRHLAEDRESRS